MDKTNIEFPPNLVKKGQKVSLQLDKPLDNFLKIKGDDYVLSYLDNNYRSNKGASSLVFALHSIDEFEDDEYDYSNPSKVIKICKTKESRWDKPSRFVQEIEALMSCSKKGFQNIIGIYETGTCIINTKGQEANVLLPYSYYTMEYAEYDLKSYIENKPLTLYEKVNLCLEISNGMSELYDLGHYHRDLKPDNILISADTWKIGDLGLINKRNNIHDLDKIAELIGPRGWYSPEALNKHLTENKKMEYSFDCQIDHQSDIFQLGKLFWYICQGNSPVGTVKQNDFKVKNYNLFAIIKTMLNHNKQKRFKHIDEVIRLLKPIHLECFKKESSSVI